MTFHQKGQYSDRDSHRFEKKSGEYHHESKRPQYEQQPLKYYQPNSQSEATFFANPSSYERIHPKSIENFPKSHFKSSKFYPAPSPPLQRQHTAELYGSSKRKREHHTEPFGPPKTPREHTAESFGPPKTQNEFGPPKSSTYQQQQSLFQQQRPQRKHFDTSEKSAEFEPKLFMSPPPPLKNSGYDRSHDKTSKQRSRLHSSKDRVNYEISSEGHQISDTRRPRSQEFHRPTRYLSKSDRSHSKPSYFSRIPRPRIPRRPIKSTDASDEPKNHRYGTQDSTEWTAKHRHRRNVDASKLTETQQENDRRSNINSHVAHKHSSTRRSTRRPRRKRKVYDVQVLNPVEIHHETVSGVTHTRTYKVESHRTDTPGVNRGGKYLTNTKLVHTTVLRTVSTKVPQTVVKTRQLISTINYSPTTTTLYRTSVYCLQPAYRNLDSQGYKLTGGNGAAVSSLLATQYRVPNLSPLLQSNYEVSKETPSLYPNYQIPNSTPYLHPINKIVDKNSIISSNYNLPKIDYAALPELNPTQTYDTDPSLYRTWVGTFVNKDTSNDGTRVNTKIPAKFILLQHMWPKSFVVGGGNLYNLNPQIKLRHISDVAEFNKRKLHLEDKPNNEKDENPILLPSPES